MGRPVQAAKPTAFPKMQNPPDEVQRVTLLSASISRVYTRQAETSSVSWRCPNRPVTGLFSDLTENFKTSLICRFNSLIRHN